MSVRYSNDSLAKPCGLPLSETHQVLFDQFEQAWIDDPALAMQAKENDFGAFMVAFDNKFMSTIITRMDSNDEIFKRVLDDQDLRTLLADFYVKKVYDQLRKVA